MNFNKTIAAAAITASSAFALTMPPTAKKTICLSVHENANGALFAGNCDNAANNKTLKKPILTNGCAQDQIALMATKYGNSGKFSIEISSCLPPNVVQL